MQIKKKILYLIRTESDFERVVCLGKSGKSAFDQNFLFVGDFSPFFHEGIQNTFQKFLFYDENFIVRDFCDYSLLGNFLKLLLKNKIINYFDVLNDKTSIFHFFISILLKFYLKKRQHKIVNKIFNKISPDFLLTDQSNVEIDYLPEIFRKKALERKIPVYLFTHGAAGGLHSVFSNPKFEKYDGYNVIVCSENEKNQETTNRIILGDVCTSFTYVNYLNKIDFDNIDFLNDRKIKIAFIIGGTAAYTSTSGWHIQEEIIIDLSNNNDVAMIVKIHPRDKYSDQFNLIKQFKNLRIVENNVDRSRIVKWADIVVTNDHTSTVFEPMILGKKVVAVQGKHLPEFKNKFSPLKQSSVNYIDNINQFKLTNLKSSNPFDPVTDKIAWGSNGPVDLAIEFLNLLN